MTLSQLRELEVDAARRRPGARQISTWLLRLAVAYRVPLTAFLAHVLVVFAIAGVAMAWFPRGGAVSAVGYYLRPATGIQHYLVQPLRNWDGFWYTLIAERGYDVHPATAAFWPLYPMLLRVARELTGLSIPLLGVVISNLALLLALGFLYRLADLDFGPRVAHRAVWLIALFPTAYYFSAVYTESLFLLFTVASVYYGRTGRWGRAAIAVGLAALARNTGALILIPLGLWLLRERGWDPRRWWWQGLQLAAGAASPLLYFWHLDRVWNDPLLTVHIQESWARHRAKPWETIDMAFDMLDLSWLSELLASPSWATLTSDSVRRGFAENQAYDVFIFLIFVPITLYMLYRVRRAYSLYALVAFVLPFFSPSDVHPLMSVPRFVVVLFPFFIALGLLLRNRWLFGAALALSVIQLAGLLIQFSTWYWVA